MVPAVEGGWDVKVTGIGWGRMSEEGGVVVALGLAVLLLLVYLQQSEGIPARWVVFVPEQLCHTVDRPSMLECQGIREASLSL